MRFHGDLFGEFAKTADLYLRLLNHDWWQPATNRIVK